MIASIRWVGADYRQSNNEGDGEFPSIWDMAIVVIPGSRFARPE
jgi:hypothetical protein